MQLGNLEQESKLVFVVSFDYFEEITPRKFYVTQPHQFLIN